MEESPFEGGRVENFVTCFACTYPAIRGHFPKVRTVHFEINHPPTPPLSQHQHLLLT